MFSRLSGRCYTGLGNRLCSNLEARSRSLEGLTEAIPGRSVKCPLAHACGRVALLSDPRRGRTRRGLGDQAECHRGMEGWWAWAGSQPYSGSSSPQGSQLPSIPGLGSSLSCCPSSRLEFVAVQRPIRPAAMQRLRLPQHRLRLGAAALLHAQKVESPAALPVNLRRNSAEFTVDYLP